MSDETIKSAAELAAERAAQAQQEQEATAAAESTEDTSAEDSKEPSIQELQQKIASLTEELEAAKDKSVRLVAEFDNFRKRNARDWAEMLEAAQGKAVSALFPIMDNFERAFQDAPTEGDWTPSDPAGFAKGMRLIRDGVRKVLADAGLEPIAADGCLFDPNLHDALTQMPHPTVPADHVAAVHAQGWKKGDKVLRHAQVIVSSGPAAT
ncbi:MAG TPA: nucleotide exchange factor GrpE [Fibrobacteria bacterium]|nr:nucleotide exchange factor GrpE [Fibrobacteria bacterium]HOX52600.1 nucleotide exchange factor GrpE [Fibrobacteria bacterium]